MIVYLFYPFNILYIFESTFTSSAIVEWLYRNLHYLETALRGIRIVYKGMSMDGFGVL